MKTFTTKPREVTPIEFELDGDIYTFTPPKRSELVMSVITSVGLTRPLTEGESLRDLLNWFSEGLGEEQNEKITARLADPEDDFDLPEVTAMARWLVGETSNRPTKRR
jgi:hypothetical protein